MSARAEPCDAAVTSRSHDGRPHPDEHGPWCPELVYLHCMYTHAILPVHDIRFEWSAAKSAVNRRTHGITFEEAQTVFADDEALLLEDPVHAGDEDRFLLLGMSDQLRVLLVVHCLRDGGNVIRLISARRATPTERAQYGARWHR